MALSIRAKAWAVSLKVESGSLYQSIFGSSSCIAGLAFDDFESVSFCCLDDSVSESLDTN